MAALAGWAVSRIRPIGLALLHPRKTSQCPSIGGRCRWDPEDSHRTFTACFGHHIDLHHTLVPTRVVCGLIFGWDSISFDKESSLAKLRWLPSVEHMLS